MAATRSPPITLQAFVASSSRSSPHSKFTACFPEVGMRAFNYTCYGVHEAAELQAALDKQCRRIDRAMAG